MAQKEFQNEGIQKRRLFGTLFVTQQFRNMIEDDCNISGRGRRLRCSGGVCTLGNKTRDIPTQGEQVNHEEFIPELAKPFHKAPPGKDLNEGGKKRVSCTYGTALVTAKSEENMKKKRRKK